MSIRPEPNHARPMIRPFPTPGTRVQLAYRELHLAVNGTDAQKEAIGNPVQLPRPWEPASCTSAELREEVWDWLEAVVIWLNQEYTWDVTPMVPTCWPWHPHLVHELAVLADQRRRAGQLAMTSDALEEWHRYCLPAFVDRMKTRCKSHCESEHSTWPGRSAHAQHLSDAHTEARQDRYTADLEALERTNARTLSLVDPDTGVLSDDEHRW